MEKEAKILVCLSVRGGCNRYIVPGSVEVICTDCGIRVYAAPSSKKLEELGNCVIVCTECGLKRLGQEEEPEFETAPGYDKEVMDWLHRQ